MIEDTLTEMIITLNLFLRDKDYSPESRAGLMKTMKARLDELKPAFYKSEPQPQPQGYKGINEI
jgi:hypothetical protein